MLHKSYNAALPTKIAVAAALLALSIVPQAARAADPAPAQFGSVDVSKLQSGYVKLDEIKNKIKAIGDDFSARLKTQQNYTMLSLDEQHQLGQLLAQPTKSDQATNAINNLENKSSHDAQELATLQQKPAGQLTDADKARLTQLTAEQQAGQQALDQVAQDYQNDFDAQQKKIGDDFSDQLRTVIGQVAKEKGISVVFDSSVAIYCANDITDDVLKKLNK